MSAIISLISNICMLGSSVIGAVTIINKIGHFFQIIEENKTDGFRKAFDCIMLESVDDINKSVTSVNLIGNNCIKIGVILYDISMGNKYVKKDKDGKIIICNKSVITTEYKNKIEELNIKLKKYEDELSKIKKTDDDNNETKSESSSDDSNEEKTDEFFLES